MTSDLDRLEERIHAAVGLLTQLREEKRRLEGENRELKERLRGLEQVAGKRGEDLKPHLRALEEEHRTLLDERRVVARRVEEMLAKLDQLQKAVHA